MYIVKQCRKPVEAQLIIKSNPLVFKGGFGGLLPDLPGKHIFPGKLYDYPGKYHYPRKNQKGCPTTLPESYFYPRKARTY